MKKYILIIFFLHHLICRAQVPVNKEPRHHNVFENAYVRILDVHVPPGDTTQFHKHETPSVFIMLSPVKTGSEVIMEEKNARARSNDAAIYFEGFYTTPRVHRVWNDDTAEFHVMDVEILNKNPSENILPVKQKAFQLVLDEKPVRAYRLRLPQGANIQLQNQKPFLIIGLTDSLQNVRVNEKLFSKKGDFVFIPSNHSIVFTSKNGQPASFAVIEFK